MSDHRKSWIDDVRDEVRPHDTNEAWARKWSERGAPSRATWMAARRHGKYVPSLGLVGFLIPVLGFAVAAVNLSSSDDEVRAGGLRYLHWAWVGLLTDVAVALAGGLAVHLLGHGL